MRGLFGKLGINAKSGEEEHRAAGFLGALEALADRAGGPAPLPPAPGTATIDDLKRLAGAEQLAEIHARRDELGRLVAEWTILAARAPRCGCRPGSWRSLFAGMPAGCR